MAVVEDTSMYGRNSLTIIVLLMLLLFNAQTVYASFVPTEWKFVKPIGLPSGITDGKYIKVYLDNDVAQGARRDFGDLRIATGDGAEIPYQLIVENEQVQNMYFPSVVRDLSVRDGTTMFILDLGTHGVVHDRLNIHTPTKNFKKNVAVYAADEELPHDSPKWRLLTASGYIYNISDTISGLDLGSGEVGYPKSTSRYLRVVIKTGEGPILTISGANVFRHLLQSATEQRMTLPAKITENDKYHTTELLVDFGGEGIPTHRVTLFTNDNRNFSRRAVVEGSSDGRRWATIGNGHVFSLITPSFTGKVLAVSYPETTHRYIRVIVFNEDDTPLMWEPTLEFEGVLRAIVFEVKRGNAYALYYGNERADGPRYDFARYFQYIDSVELPLATLGAATPNAAYIPPTPPSPPYTETHPRVFDIVLVLLVAVVTFLTIGYLKTLKIEYISRK